MSTVTVFVGQCGNQVGSAFLDSITTDATLSASYDYQMRVSSQHFRDPLRITNRSGKKTRHYYSPSPDSSGLESLPQPRCVLVDMEPKVVEQVMERANRRPPKEDAGTVEESTLSTSPRSLYSLAPQQCVTRGEGSGNNWACGFYQQGERCRENIMECLRCESEGRDTITSYHVLHSVAGGTGSGVGCLVAEAVKDEYPHVVLQHSLVWPFSSGEVVTQWFNVVMAMSTLRDLVDSAFVAYNDNLLADLRGSEAARGRQDATSVNYDDMNMSLARLLTPLHLPQQAYVVPPPQRDTSKNRIEGSQSAQEHHECNYTAQRYTCAEDLVEGLTLDPAMKFYAALRVPALCGSTTTTWSSLMSDAARRCCEEFQSCSTAFAVPLPDSSSQHTLGGFAQTPRRCLWAIRGCHAVRDGLRALQDVMATHSAAGMPFPLTTLWVSPNQTSTPPRKDMCGSRSDHEIVMYGHSPTIRLHLEKALRRVEELLRVRAFVHHFERYGVTRDDVEDAVVRLWDTVAAYGGESA